MSVGVVHAGHEAVLVVDVGLEGHAVNNGDLVGLGGEGSGNASKEATLLLLEGHRADVVQRHRVAVGVGDGGVDHDELVVGVGLGDVTHGGEVIARKHEGVVVANDLLDGGDQVVVVRLLDVVHGAVGVVLQELLDAVVAVLVERAIVDSRGGDDDDL